MGHKKAFSFFLWMGCSVLGMKNGSEVNKSPCGQSLLKVLSASSCENQKKVFAQENLKQDLKNRFNRNKEGFPQSTVIVESNVIKKNKQGSLDKRDANLVIQRSALIDSRDSVRSLFGEFFQWFGIAFCGVWLGSEGVYPMLCGIKSEPALGKQAKSKFYFGAPPLYKLVSKFTGDTAAPWVLRFVSAVLLAGNLIYLKNLKAENMKLRQLSRRPSKIMTQDKDWKEGDF